MKVVYGLILALTSHIAFAGAFSSMTNGEYKYRSAGKWNDKAGKSGGWTSECTYTKVDDSTMTVSSVLKIHDAGNITEMTSNLTFKESANGFIDVLDKDGNVKGSGYCYKPACHYTYQDENSTTEETIAFRHHYKKFKLIGSHTTTGDAATVTSWAGRGYKLD